MISTQEQENLGRLQQDFGIWAEDVGKIVDKASDLVGFELNAAQTELERRLEAQRAQGKPQRAIVLKARQVGISTYAQAKLIHRATNRANHYAAVVAHDRETGVKLYRMGERFYTHLPGNEELGLEANAKGLKPPLMSHRRARFLHLGNDDQEAWVNGQVWPDSTYYVDTANEFQAGRGATYHSLHLSELAFWEQPETKLAALHQAVPRSPDTLIIIESTANGANAFKDLWDGAEAGRNAYEPFFWPWHAQPEYRQPFANEAEAKAFRVGEGPYGEDEPALVENHDLDNEQLHWRRKVIATECLGKLAVFQAEYPSTPEEAFISTGRQVFDQHTVASILIDVEMNHDSREPPPGPKLMALRATSHTEKVGRLGKIEVPADPEWIDRKKLTLGDSAHWKVWAAPEEDHHYVIGVDVSGGVAGGEQTDQDDPAYDAIEIIDHESREQVAEFAARLDADLLAEQVYLAALSYNRAWVAIEVTGSWGLPVARRVWMDYRHPYVYNRKRLTASMDRQEDRLGWDTNRQTKPVLEAGGAELLREGTHGIRSRDLVLEMKTHIKDPKGKTGPEPGKFNDRLLAWMIAQQVATLLPLKKVGTAQQIVHRQPSHSVTGY